ncbi:hypothetical protein SAMN05216480_11934 [Pustulibacterium marinum]|uniref:MetA-pathway of phenol degradation n=1 Tax=Pustulibacterium marinum TaxID=1224947 RepID=A0A1I7IQB6_9FLAO|nr:hypothetical protein [Pustulibacterium marinum]SFU75119.1 hypothetical protein SAMN05216480_11934 [Pustulibacterium marinum]
MKQIFYTAILVLSCQLGVYAQTESETISEDKNEEKVEKYQPFNFNLQVKNMHLWRGYRVTDAPMTAADVNYLSKNGKFKAGLWGGSGFNGDYHEFDYYVSYTTGGFNFAIWDINNYSDYPDAKIFNYDIGKTSHFIDVSAAYTFKKIPLKLSWATIVLGRDFYENDNGELKNSFSHYVEGSYILTQKENWSLGVYAGFAFSATSDDDTNFYGPKSGFNNIGVVYNRDLNVFDKITIPVSATAMWNTIQDYGAIQVAVNLF